MKKENFIDKNFSNEVVLHNSRSLNDEKRGEILRKEDNGSWISIYQSSGEYINVPQEFGRYLDGVLQTKLDKSNNKK